MDTVVTDDLVGYASDWFGITAIENDPAQTRDTHASNGTSATTSKSYRATCEDVIRRYLDGSVPCEFVIQRHGRKLPCQNAKVTHDRHAYYHWYNGMYNEPTYYMGRFENAFDMERYAWADKILNKMETLQAQGEKLPHSEGRRNAALVHQESVRKFYYDVGGAANFVSHAICLCCLSNPPEYHLACGHVICYQCALDFGRQHDVPVDNVSVASGQSKLQVVDKAGNTIIDECPLCSDDDRLRTSQTPTIVERPPAHSGLRVLTLDGQVQRY